RSCQRHHFEKSGVRAVSAAVRSVHPRLQKAVILSGGDGREANGGGVEGPQGCLSVKKGQGILATCVGGMVEIHFRFDRSAIATGVLRLRSG
ncbi:MAG TPA: hypothetical protein VK829_03295, partial [Terriglobales bacterium]|nr:hypothetical protein [Terriglobales bacterium]